MSIEAEKPVRNVVLFGLLGDLFDHALTLLDEGQQKDVVCRWEDATWPSPFVQWEGHGSLAQWLVWMSTPPATLCAQGPGGVRRRDDPEVFDKRLANLVCRTNALSAADFTRGDVDRSDDRSLVELAARRLAGLTEDEADVLFGAAFDGSVRWSIGSGKSPHLGDLMRELASGCDVHDVVTLHPWANGPAVYSFGDDCDLEYNLLASLTGLIVRLGTVADGERNVKIEQATGSSFMVVDVDDNDLEVGKPYLVEFNEIESLHVY